MQKKNSEEHEPKPKSAPKEWKGSEKLDKVYQYAQNNVWDTLALAVLILGLLISLIHVFIGGLLVGLVGGYYFSDAIVKIVKNIRATIANEGTIRSLILGGVALGLFIASPGILIGAIAGIGVRQFVVSV